MIECTQKIIAIMAGDALGIPVTDHWCIKPTIHNKIIHQRIEMV